MIKVIFTPAFNQALKKLHKRYPHILNALERLVLQLESGQTPGDRIQGLPYKVYKVRIKNSDAKRGKSGGYRTVYYIETVSKIAAITIYSKSDQSDIPIEVIRRLIEQLRGTAPAQLRIIHMRIQAPFPEQISTTPACQAPVI